MDREKEQQVIFDMPDNENIPCKGCKFASSFYLDYFCAKYKMKPKEIYYENKDCPFKK